MDVRLWKKDSSEHSSLPLFYPYAITNSPLVEAGWAGRTRTHQYHFDPRMQLLDSPLDSWKPWSMARTSELSYRARPLEWTRSCQAAINKPGYFHRTKTLMWNSKFRRINSFKLLRAVSKEDSSNLSDRKVCVKHIVAFCLDLGVK